MADEETVNAMTRAAVNADDKTLIDILGRTPPGTVNRPNKYGHTAIQVMNFMSPATARILLEYGADPNVRDLAVGRTILHDIAEKGCLPTLQLLLEHGADATARDNMGNTPAHLAAREGGQSRIQILEKLSHSCFLNEVNNTGETPLDLAIENQHAGIIAWLQNFHSEPLTLQFQARRAIRIRIRLVDSLKGLIPQPLIQYLKGR